MRTQEAVRWLVFCHTCTAGVGEWCRTPTGRNHPSRVAAAIEQALYDLAWPQNESARIRERMRRDRAKAAGLGFERLEPARRVAVRSLGAGVK